MAEEIGLFEALFTQRALRKLKPDDVPDELINKLIESATKAPSGGDRQPWRFLVIRDPQTKRQIAEYYLRAWEQAYPSGSVENTISAGVYASADHLARNMAGVPVLIMACIERTGTEATFGLGGSIFPAVQNLLLAARGLGLGALTSLHKRYDSEIKALLGIPDNVETAALLPVGYPEEGTRYGPTRRAPVADVSYREKWGQVW